MPSEHELKLVRNSSMRFQQLAWLAGVLIIDDLLWRERGAVALQQTPVQLHNWAKHPHLSVCIDADAKDRRLGNSILQEPSTGFVYGPSADILRGINSCYGDTHAAARIETIPQ